jgi:hypothetical protein
MEGYTLVNSPTQTSKKAPCCTLTMLTLFQVMNLTCTMFRANPTVLSTALLSQSTIPWEQIMITIEVSLADPIQNASGPPNPPLLLLAPTDFHVSPVLYLVVGEADQALVRSFPS